jgi:DNA-binding NtrC family response regulator
MNTTNILWADDDCEGFLSGLGDILTDEGFILSKASNFTEAVNHLENPSNQFDSALLDVILPNDIGAFTTELGLSLAEKVAQKGIKRILFLSVVRHESVMTKIGSFKSKFEQALVKYFDKTTLLEPGEIDKIINFLKNENI